MRETEDGKDVGRALTAVAVLHSELRRLLRDSDSLFPEHEVVFGSTVTRDLTHALERGFWMAEGLYRFWRKEGGPVAGLTAILCSSDDPSSPEEPILVAGRMWFSRAPTVNDSWLLWHAHRDWDESRPVGRLMEFSPTPVDGVEKVVILAVPLYHIERIDDVKQLFKKLGEVLES